MSDIPVHLQRRFEQRWAARFVRPGASATPKSIDLKDTVNSLERPAKEKEKPPGFESVDLVSTLRTQVQRDPR
jgi:hypothetical protein